MKYLKLLSALFIASLAFVACSDDDKDGSVRWERKSLFLSYGESVTVGIGGENISSYSIYSVPKGWEKPVIDRQTMTVTVVAPEAPADTVAVSGDIKLNGITHGAESVYANLFVSLDTPEVDFTAQPANSYLATKGGALYRFNGRVKGDGSALQTESVSVIWQTSTNFVKYLQLEQDGSVSFFLANDSEDETKIREGNAVIAAYDAAGEIIWSWHIWATDYDVEAEALDYGDYTVMSRALGQLENATEDKTSILASYGLYYQWGRKDPFAGPSLYNASKGVTATLYDGDTNVVIISPVEATAETGNYAYTNAHPMHFITVKDKNAAWNQSITTEVKGWENTQQKSVNDPCPYGWRVAPAEAFEGLTISDDLTAADASTKYAEQYGWTLKKNEVESFYFAGGRRVYADALIQNIFDESLTRNAATEAQPWVGYNWTADGKVFAFWFNKQAPAESSLRNDLKFSTANGMMVRCVKE